MLKSFAKILSANDTGATGGHQGGILVPKSDPTLLAFFPFLDASFLNPDAWLEAADIRGRVWKLRYIYYNNRLHLKNGTRNEYRLTHLTQYLRETKARVGDSLVLTGTESPRRYLIEVAPAEQVVEIGGTAQPIPSGVVKLTGWRRVH
jgi:hypothetical protein